MHTIPHHEAPSIFEEDQLSTVEYATPGERFVNFLIDTILIRILLFALYYFLKFNIVITESRVTETGSFVSYNVDSVLIDMGCFALIYLLIEGLTKGYTLGKVVTGTRAVQFGTFAPINWKDAFIRSISRVVPFEPFTGFSGNPWHDQWSKTTVIKVR